MKLNRKYHDFAFFTAVTALLLAGMLLFATGYSIDKNKPYMGITANVIMTWVAASLWFYTGVSILESIEEANRGELDDIEQRLLEVLTKHSSEEEARKEIDILKNR